MVHGDRQRLLMRGCELAITNNEVTQNEPVLPYNRNEACEQVGPDRDARATRSRPGKVVVTHVVLSPPGDECEPDAIVIFIATGRSWPQAEQRDERRCGDQK